MAAGTLSSVPSQAGLPRVTYSNIGEDFSLVHDYVDALIPVVERQELGRFRPNLIAGRDDDRGTAYTAASPIDRDLLLGRFVAATPAAVSDAVDAARVAFDGWRKRGWRERIAVLRRAAAVMDARKHAIAVACLIEVGKSRLEAIGEVEETVDLIRYYCDQMEENEGFDRPMRRAFPQEATRCVLRPYGVFAVIAPFNFPVALSVAMMTGALAAGNTVVYKPSPLAGLTARLAVDCFVEAGLPAGVINMVCGGRATGRALVDHPYVDGVVFTGSHATGMAILRSFATRDYARPVIAEMGGKNPTYVTRQADLATAVTGVVRSAFGLQGQKCSAGSVVFVEDAVCDVFVDAVVRAAEALRMGDPRRRDVFLGPLINEDAGRRFAAASSAAREAGSLRTGGTLASGNGFDRGFYAPPTVAADLPDDHPLHRDELFLPFLTVRRFSSLANAIERGNAVPYGLTAGIYTQDEAELALFLDKAEVGVLYANRASGASTGAWPGIQTFCGWKGSGTTGKGGLGPWYLPQFMREQSQTVMSAG